MKVQSLAKSWTDEVSDTASSRNVSFNFNPSIGLSFP